MSRPKVDPYPALKAWQQRFHREGRHRFDALWSVACWEASARDAADSGQWNAWRLDLMRARKITRGAA